MTERRFGAEIVESDIGGDIVTDVKAATALLVGTFPVHTVHPVEADRAAYIEKPILIRRRSDIAAHFGEYTSGYTIVRDLDAIFDQDQGAGVGTIEVINVFDPARHKDGDDNPDVTLVTNNDIIGTFDGAGNPTGLKHAYASFQRWGWFPKFVEAPSFMGLVGVRDEINIINNKIRARTYFDAPAGVSVQDVIAARGPDGDFDLQTNSRRLIPCFPHMEAADPANAGETMLTPYSATLMGVHLASIMAHGYHHSPSNRPIEGRKPAQQIRYTPGMADDDTQLLRGAGVVTCEERWGKGAHTSGNRSAAFPTDTNMKNFIHVQLIADMLHEAVLYFLDQHKDRNAGPATLSYIEGLINDWGKAKTVGTDPVLLGFKFWFDRTQTTPQSYADGHIYWKMKWMPVGLMEWLTVEEAIDINLASDPLGLSAAA